MRQVSNDVRMLLPLLAGILVAKWVADAATHSLYHGLLEVACVPFLPASPNSPVSLDLLPVCHYDLAGRSCSFGQSAGYVMAVTVLMIAMVYWHDWMKASWRAACVPFLPPSPLL